MFPSVPTAGASLGTPTIYALTPNYRTPYTINSSIQITRQLGSNDALTVGYVNTEARQLTYMRDLNLINPTSFLADGRPVYSAAVNASTRLFPQFNGITLMDSGPNANYNALIVNLTHRFSTGFSMNASYTWSHSLSDASGAVGLRSEHGDRGSHQSQSRLRELDHQSPERFHHERGVHAHLQAR